MTTPIDQHKTAIDSLCRRYAVRRLELFGSAVTTKFDPNRSDLDFLVDFGPDSENDLFHRYFGLQEALQKLSGRNVDLVMVGAMKNPHFIESVNRSRQLVYATQVA